MDEITTHMVVWKRYTGNDNRSKDYFIGIGKVKTSLCQQTSQREGSLLYLHTNTEDFSMIFNQSVTWAQMSFLLILRADSLLTLAECLTSSAAVSDAQQLPSRPSQTSFSSAVTSGSLKFFCSLGSSPSCAQRKRRKSEEAKRTETFGSLISPWWMLLNEMCECHWQSITSLLNSCMLLTDCRHPELRESSSPHGNLKFHLRLLFLWQNAWLRWPI